MTKLTVDKIDKDELLRYLGVKEKTYDKSIDDVLMRACDTTLESITPRAIYNVFDIDILKDANLIEGNDIVLHLNRCKSAILLALTLGIKIEEKIRTANTKDALFPVALDACASVAIETLHNKYHAHLAEQFMTKGLYLTESFSPGYGDFPIEKQHILLQLVDGERKIGLCATQSHILTPRKSITAVIGIADFITKGKRAGCDGCALKEKCEYKRKGKMCNV